MLIIRNFLAGMSLISMLLPVVARADIRVSEGAFEYTAESDVRYAYVGSESDTPLPAGGQLVISPQDHMVIRSDQSKISIIPLLSQGGDEVLESARKLMGFWMPESVRRHAVLVLHQFSQEVPLDALCRVFVIGDKISDNDRGILSELATNRGVEIRFGLQDVELRCKSGR